MSANIYLDQPDKELERRGLAHVRYADDCNIYVSSDQLRDAWSKYQRG